MENEPDEETLSEGVKVRLNPTQHNALKKAAKGKLKKPATLARDLVVAFLVQHDPEYRDVVEKELGQRGVQQLLEAAGEVRHPNKTDPVVPPEMLRDRRRRR